MAGQLRLGRSAKVLLLNPPIADTAEAEDLGLITCVEPLGLLRLASYFRQRGAEVRLLDCLRDPWLQGRLRRHVRKSLPCGAPGARRRKQIHHFGLDAGQLRARLGTLPEPDLIAVGSVMTWHIDAAREALRVCKEVFPNSRLVLGGNLATLCPGEAARSAADEVFRGDVPGAAFLPTAIDLMADRRRDHLRLIKGCPFHCSYCATHRLNGGRVAASSPEAVFADMQDKIRRFGTQVFSFFDDFSLYRPERYLSPFLRLAAEARPGVVLEFSLGFNAHMLTERLVGQLRAAGVAQMALALESINEGRRREMRRPNHLAEFLRAVDLLKAHGYQGRDLKAFLLIGLPDQTTDEILRAILFLLSLGIAPSLTTYALTPGTRDMDTYRSRVPFQELDELTPGLWRFAHEGMRPDELDLLYRRFHERYCPVEQAADGVGGRLGAALRRLLRGKAYVPGAR